MKGLRKVNADLVGFAQSRSPQTEATLDMDATLVETRKQEALPSYKKYRAYQPLITYWSEAELIVHSEFRDGNVPAGHHRVLIEAWAGLRGWRRWLRSIRQGTSGSCCGTARRVETSGSG